MENDFENQNNEMETGTENPENSFETNNSNSNEENYYNQSSSAQTNLNGQPVYNANKNTNSQPNYNAQMNYNNNQYGNYNGQFNPYNANGGAPLDKNGQPMKNNFGMKLTFSILEILCCNLISLILGIVSCVFTCKANTAYKQGKWDEFKSSAKTATITLWIGFGGFVLEVICCIVLLVMGISVATIASDIEGNDSYYSDDYDSDDYDSNDYDYDDDEDEEDDATDNITPSNVTAGSGFTDATVTLNGQTMTFPVTFADFTAATGLTLDADDATYVLNEEEYDLVGAYDSSEEDICSIWIMNLTENPLAMQDCYVVGIIAYNESYSVTPDLVIQNGITFASTQDDVKTALGEPTETNSSTSDGSTRDTWTWQSANPNADYFDEIEIDFVDGVIYSIEVDNSHAF